MPRSRSSATTHKSIPLINTGIAEKARSPEDEMSCSRTGADCKCTYSSCSRKGNCCQCVAFHRERGEATGCMFTPEGERTHDRSLKNLMRDRRITF